MKIFGLLFLSMMFGNSAFASTESINYLEFENTKSLEVVPASFPSHELGDQSIKRGEEETLLTEVAAPKSFPVSAM